MLATRGLLSVDVTVETGAVDLHSGHYGGVALNAVNALLETLAAVLPREGVLRDELRVGVEPPSQEELASWARLAPGAAQLERRGARPLPGALDAYHARRWAEPSLDLNGVLGGKPGRRNTSIPVRAQAELSLRLVPDQRVEEVGAVVERLLRDAAPAGATLGVRWEGVPPARVPAEHPAVRLAAAALERALGAPPRLVRSGGTMPVVAAFAELGIPALLVPLGVPEGNQHAPNERLPLEALPREPARRDRAAPLPRGRAAPPQLGGQLERQAVALAQALEVAPVEDAHDHPLGAQLPDLPVLARGQLLSHGGALDVDVRLGEEEVGGERLCHVPLLVALEDEGVRLVLPGDAELVEHRGELALHGVREGEFHRQPVPAVENS